MLQGNGGSIRPRLCAGVRPPDRGDAHELHLWAPSIRHRGSGLDRAFPAEHHPQQRADDLWRRPSGPRCASRLRRGLGLAGRARWHRARPWTRLQSRRRSGQRDQSAGIDRPHHRSDRPQGGLSLRRLEARGSALVRDRHARALQRARLGPSSFVRRWTPIPSHLAGRPVRIVTRQPRGAGMTRVALINPNWDFGGSIYFGCRSPHLPLELGISEHYLKAAGHKTLLLDAHMFDLSLADIHAELRAFGPDQIVITTAPTYLFWRCAPPELRVPQELARAVRDLAPILIAVGPHGSTVPRAALRKLGTDIVVMGECEASLLRLANGERDFPGLCFADGASLRVNGGPHAGAFKDQPPPHWPAGVRIQGAAAASLAGGDDPAAPPSPPPFRSRAAGAGR